MRSRSSAGGVFAGDSGFAFWRGGLVVAPRVRPLPHPPLRLPAARHRPAYAVRNFRRGTGHGEQRARHARARRRFCRAWRGRAAAAAEDAEEFLFLFDLAGLTDTRFGVCTGCGRVGLDLFNTCLQFADRLFEVIDVGLFAFFAAIDLSLEVIDVGEQLGCLFFEAEQASERIAQTTAAMQDRTTDLAANRRQLEVLRARLSSPPWCTATPQLS